MTNRLSAQTSPYLLQHAGNPVDWQPWDDEALAQARRDQKPILLSVGYSACHWCHVMAHESFEDPATARVMNEHFINIKVDREERPDLDKVYQLAHQLLTQQGGGWPLTMFLDPDTLLPFFGGTYFPKTPRYQLPGFTDLLLRIADVFGSKREELTEQGDRVAEVLGRIATPDDESGLVEDAQLLAAGREQLGSQADSAEGGFGEAPKFPMPSTLARLLQHWAFSQQQSGPAADGPDRGALEIVMTALTRMARGGIYDHLGGGFCRYATDRKWMIPHFEKMLYDNGQLLSLYADVLAIGPDDLFGAAVADTADWLLREMRHPGGGFFAALDADSEGEEGKFYLWRRDQVKKLLSDDEYLVIETLYGLDKPANFESRWNLHRFDAWRSVVERLSMTREDADALLASARAKLLTERDTRVRPGRDEKILTAWNGLAIKGLAKAGSRLGEPRWVDAAGQAADFLRENLMVDGTLFATWMGEPRHPAYLDDYANLIDGLLALLASGWRDADARFALELADAALEQFYDAENGGFYFTAHDHETLIHRPKPTMDDALPPGNGVMVQVLSTLGHLFAEQRYLDAAHATLAWARPAMAQYPAGHCSLLSGLQMEMEPPQLVIIRGPEGADTDTWRQVLDQGYTPWRTAFIIPY
ncbi:MAG: thioredoxin domain-containing protein, partial [Gammaproteobacteria bacterium]|nr:thioredoxin domain-containing protein [Gammaproteobacteria bacterium]